MFDFKSLIAAAMLSGLAVASFAQAPAVATASTDKVVNVSEPKGATTAPAVTASKPGHKAKKSAKHNKSSKADKPADASAK